MLTAALFITANKVRAGQVPMGGSMCRQRAQPGNSHYSERKRKGDCGAIEKVTLNMCYKKIKTTPLNKTKNPNHTKGGNIGGLRMLDHGW